MSSLKSVKLFISYSHDDSPYFEVFNKGFSKVIKNAKNFDWKIWDDTKIYIGSFWDDEIQRNVKECDVAILLVSVGFMSSNYIKEKEYYEFLQRYKNKGVLIIPVVFCPCDFDAWDDLAKLQFFKPKGSEFDEPEVINFTYADLIKFNQKNGILIPNPNIERYHLKLFKKIEESYTSFYNEIEKKTILKIDKPQNIDSNILFDFPKPTSLFTGRNNEIIQFKEMLKSFRIIAIDGLGGTGKTQFAAKYIQDCIVDKSKIIWLNGSVQSSFDIFVEYSGYGDVLKGDIKTDLSIFSGFKDLIEKDSRIIFWDNFNDYEDQRFAEFLSFAYPFLVNSTIILITKIEPKIEGILTLPILQLNGLNEDALEYGRKLKSTNYQYNSISDLDIDEICNAVDGHPLAIEFSLYLLSRGKSAHEIINHLPEIKDLKKIEEFSKRLFLNILNHQTTTEEERECFLKCSVFKNKISESEIKYLNDGLDVYHLIDGLIDKLLLTSRNGYFEIHPLVRSFSYEMLEEKKVIHKKAGLYFISCRIDILSPSLEEKIYYHLSEAEEWEMIANSIEKYGKSFIQLGQINFLLDSINKINYYNINRDIFNILKGDITQIKSEWDEALKYFEAATKSSSDIIKAEGLIKIGEIYFRTGRLQEANKYFQEANLFANEKKLEKEEARSINDIGLIELELTNYDNAIINFDLALAIRIKISDWEGIANTYNNIGNIFLHRHKNSEAIEYFEKSIKISEEIGDKISLRLYYSNIGNSLKNQGKLNDAYKYYIKALKSSEEIGDKSGIAHSYNAIGTIYSIEKKYEKAFEKYNIALEISVEINDLRNIGASYHNIGVTYFEINNYKSALENIYKALNFSRKIGSKNDEKVTSDWLKDISKKMGVNDFVKISKEVLENEKENFINHEEFLKNPYLRQLPKINRNDIVKVQYKATGIVVEAKFKKIEKDLNIGECYIVTE